MVAGSEDLSQSLEARVQEFTLSNGLHFIVLERSIAPIVSCHTYADVGAFDEVDGQTGAYACLQCPDICSLLCLWACLSLCIPVGIAHLLEHMAFKGDQQVTVVCCSAMHAKSISTFGTVCHSAYIVQAALALEQKIMLKKPLSLEPLMRVLAIFSAHASMRETSVVCAAWWTSC